MLTSYITTEQLSKQRHKINRIELTKLQNFFAVLQMFFAGPESNPGYHNIFSYPQIEAFPQSFSIFHGIDIFKEYCTIIS